MKDLGTSLGNISKPLTASAPAGYADVILTAWIFFKLGFYELQRALFKVFH